MKSEKENGWTLVMDNRFMATGSRYQSCILVRLVREPPSFRTGGSGSRRPQNRGSGSGSGSRVYVVQSAPRNLVSCRNKKLIQIQNNYNYYYTTNDCYVVCTLHAQVHAFTSHTSSYDFNTCIHHHEWKEQK